jgi:hypothetical protein
MSKGVATRRLLENAGLFPGYRGKMSDLGLLAAADDLNNRYRVTGREGLPAGLVELVMDTLPFRILRF